MAKFVIVTTHGKDDLERATIPWAVANAAIALEHEVLIFLQGCGVSLARKGYSDGLVFPPFPPLKKLIEDLIALGGKIYVCGPCMQAHILEENDLINGAKPAGAGFLVEESVNAIVYSY